MSTQNVLRAGHIVGSLAHSRCSVKGCFFFLFFFYCLDGGNRDQRTEDESERLLKSKSADRKQQKNKTKQNIVMVEI